MKTLQLTMEVIQSYHLLFNLLILSMIKIVFIVDLFIYIKMLKKRNRLQTKLVVLEINEFLNKFLEDETIGGNLNMSEEEKAQIYEQNNMLKSQISSISSDIKEIEHKIENYKGLSKLVLGFIGVK